MAEELIKNVPDRSKPPVVQKAKDVKFPEFFETKTSNGITVIVIEDRATPVITSRIVFKTGSLYDNGRDGLASMTYELINKGTKTKSALEIADEVDYYGGGLMSMCSYDSGYVTSYGLSKYFDRIFDITADVILNPVFADGEIDRLRKQRLNSILSYMDDGEYLASRLFKKLIFNKSQYAGVSEGKLESINSITAEEIKAFHNAHFNPDNMIAAFVGDISAEDAVKITEEKFSGWKTGNNNIGFNFIQPEEHNKRSVHIFNREGSVQSSLKLGHLSVKRNIPDYVKIMVMNTILGGSFISRLNHNLREVNGYTYGVRSGYDSNLYCGDFAVETEVSNEVTEGAIKETLKELSAIREEKVSEEELDDVKSYLTGSFPLQLETPNAIASKVINIKLFGLEKDYYNTFISKVNETTREDVLETAQKYLKPEEATIVLSGQASALKDKLSSFGDVTVHDTL